MIEDLLMIWCWLLFSWCASGLLAMENKKPVKKLTTLKKTCIRSLVKENSFLAKEILSSGKLPAEVRLLLGCKMLKKGSFENATEVMSLFDSCFFPHLFLNVLTIGNTARRQEKTLWYGIEMRNIAQERGDRHLKLYLDDMFNFARRTEHFIKADRSIPSIIIQRQLLSRAIVDMVSIVPVRILCQYETPDFWLDGYLERPMKYGYFSSFLSTYNDKLREEEVCSYAKRYNLPYTSEKDKKQVKKLVALSKRNKEILVGLHKFIVLGFEPLYNKYPTICSVIRYSLNRMRETLGRNNWSFDCGYAQFKLELDRKEYEVENRKYKNEMWAFYALHPQRNNISYIQQFISNERYCYHVPLFNQMLNEKEGFYRSILKLLCMYRKDEFNSWKRNIAETLQMQEDEVEQTLLNDTYYNKSTVLHTLWTKRVNTLRMPGD